MSSHAYPSPARTKPIDNQYARQHLAEFRENHTTGYCPTHHCPAKLIPLIREDNLIWRSIPSAPHSPDCVYGCKAFAQFDPHKYNYRTININDFLARFENPVEPRTNQTGKSPHDKRTCSTPQTLRETYFLFKNLPLYIRIHNQQIRNILVDSRSSIFHSENAISGRHIGELRFIRYDATAVTKRIDARVPLAGNSPITVSLLFENADLFFETKKKLFAKTTSPSRKTIVVAGRWMRSEYTLMHYNIHITSKKQLYIFNLDY